MPTVRVCVQSESYEVLVEQGAIAQVGKRLREMGKSGRVGVITDSNVGPLYAESVRQSLVAAGLEPVGVRMPAGEEHKSLTTLLPVFDTLLAAKVERSTPVIALGGGVVGDMGGFVAATLLRGVPFVQIPTTLLAMVDASVGGKVGVDTRYGKNLIGAFHQPVAVFADPLVLRTLPRREMQGGLAECIKHDIIRDAAGFSDLEKNIGRALAGDMEYLTTLVAHNVEIKARIVQADPFERGERAHLNLGHTFGHAVESISGFAIAHGQAVALGITAAADVGVSLGLLKEDERKRIVRLLEQAGLPTGGLGLDAKAIYDAMFFDKKVKDGRLRLVLPSGIGQVVIRDDVPAQVIREAIESLKKGE